MRVSVSSVTGTTRCGDWNMRAFQRWYVVITEFLMEGSGKSKCLTKRGGFPLLIRGKSLEAGGACHPGLAPDGRIRAPPADPVQQVTHMNIPSFLWAGRSSAGVSVIRGFFRST